MNVKVPIPIFRELFIPSGSKPEYVLEIAAFFASMQRQERCKGGPVSRRSADSHELICYQLKGTTWLSREVRQGLIKKVTKRSQSQMMTRDKYLYQAQKKAARCAAFFCIWLRLLGSNQRPND